MKRLIEETVFSGLTAACRRARLPTRRSPDLVNAATEGVVREPSELGMTTGSPPSMTAITELVVPRSIPTVLGICSSAVGICCPQSLPSFPRRNLAETRWPEGGRGAARTVKEGTLTAVARSIDLDPIDGIGVGTIGPPGQRQFFIRASQAGETYVLYCEKFHVQGLVVRIRQLLEAQGLGSPPEALQPPGAEPGDPEWIVGQLGLGFHESKRLFVIVARQAAENEDDDPDQLATARFWATPEQVMAFTRQAERVLSSGRPTCPYCGLPIDPGGHPCPAGNGSRPIL